MSNPNRKKAIKKLRLLSYNPKTDINVFRKKIDDEFKTIFLPEKTECKEKTFGGIKCDLLVPELHSSKRILFYIHGGCFTGGSRVSYRNFCSTLAIKTYSRAVLPEYRLAPSHPFPAALDDVLASFRAMFTEEQVSLSIESRKSLQLSDEENLPEVVVAADGAGASIACAMIFSLKERYKKSIERLILFSPWLDISDETSIKSIKKISDEVISGEVISKSADAYSYSSNLSNPLVSPLYAKEEMFKVFPETYIQVGEKEILKDDSLRFSKKLESFGVKCTVDVWKNMIHLFQLADEELEEAHEALDKVSYIVSSGMESKQNEEKLSFQNKPILENSLSSEA